MSLLSAFTAGSVQYYILELCINGSLQDVLLLRRSHALCENELRGVVKGLVDALIYLRKERVIHRDIKPSNILLSESSRVVSRRTLCSASTHLSYRNFLISGFPHGCPLKHPLSSVFKGPRNISPRESRPECTLIRWLVTNMYIVRLLHIHRTGLRRTYGPSEVSWSLVSRESLPLTYVLAPLHRMAHENLGAGTFYR